MKIVIVGAGIAGCTAYLQLSKHLPGSHEVTIYEPHSTNIDSTWPHRADGPTHSATLAVGGGLGVGPNGLQVLKRLDEGLLRDVVRGGYAVGHSNLKSKNGTLLIRMQSKAASGVSAMNMLGCSRHALWKCLRSRVPDRVFVNKRVSAVVANADGPNVVRFADGSPQVQADLVVGADGVRSTVKRAIFHETEEDPYPPRYEGLVGIGGFLPSSDVEHAVEKGSMNFVFGGNGFFGYFYSESAAADPNRDSPYDVSEPGDTISWWSTYSIDECPDPRSIDTDHVAQQLRERHAQWKDPVVQSVIRSVRVDNMYPTWTSPQLPTWERDGVVLVGDAAHALPTTSGQGSSQALEDVEALALLLSHYTGSGSQSVQADKEAIRTAAKRYVHLRQPRVQAVLDQSQKMQNSKRNMSVVEEYFMYCMMWIVGFFPSLVSGPLIAVSQYNVAEQVDQMLATDQISD
ncbi:Extracellular salicylate hydroxylase monooxygenase [Aspergillus sp. HF37]|nr:Extracellular salicylate hydroxylase monooxygenase [Aspergillus sp. HF37]